MKGRMHPSVSNRPHSKVWLALGLLGLAVSQPATLLAQDESQAETQESATANAPDAPEASSADTARPPAREVSQGEGQPEVENPAASTGWQDFISQHWMVLALVLAILVFIALVAWVMYGRNRSSYDQGQQSSRRRSPAAGYDAGPGQPQGYAHQPVHRQVTMTHDELVDRVSRLERQIQILTEMVNRMENRSAMSAGADRTSTAAQMADREYSMLDRRNERVSLPDDDARMATRTGAPPPPVRPTAASTGSGNYGRSIDARAVVENYNQTVKPGDLATLAETLGAEYYTNERSGDISALFKSDVDRFWLIPNPDRPDEALLIPGFTIRKSWQKYRQVASDHPLVHHFDLQRGEKFVVNRAALLRRDSNGEWQLVEKGEVSGIS